MNNVGIILTARVQSSRIKEKALQKINNKMAIEILLDNLLKNKKYPVVLAIPTDKDNDILKEIAEEKGVEVFRGDNDSPLHRLYNAAQYFDFDYVARITMDDILIDSIILKNQIKMAIRGSQEYCYCRRIPEGCGAEIIKTNILKDVIDKVGEKPIEFISYYLKNRYKTFEYYPSPEHQFNYRLTMDYPEDLMLLRIIFTSLSEPIGTLDIINFLKRHKYFTQINHMPSVTAYTCNYNTADYVIDTMKSVLKQTFTDFEYIIIDDCSTDNSMNVITEYYSTLSLQDQNKIKIIRNDVNIGLPACCNKILSIARGKNIVRIDSDDIIDSTMFQLMVDQLKIDDSQACFSGYNSISIDSKIIDTINTNMNHPGCCMLSTWAANELKYRDGLDFMEGEEFFSRFKKIYKESFISDPLWSYRIRPGQKTQQKEHPNNEEVK